MSDGLLSELATRLGKKLALTTDDWEKYNPSISFDVLSRCEAKVLYPHLRLQNGIAHDHDFVPGATEATFDLERLHPNFRNGVKVMRTPEGIEFAANRFFGKNESDDLIWIRSAHPVMVMSECDEHGDPTISFGDISLYGDGEDGDEGRIAIRFPMGTVEI